MVLSVKSALAEHLEKIKAHLKTASNLAEDTALSSQEHEVIQLLRGLVLELVDESMEDHEVDTEASAGGIYFDPAVPPPPTRDHPGAHRPAPAPIEPSPGGRAVACVHVGAE